MHAEWANQIVAARRAGRALPVLSARYADATLADAFEVQKRAVAALDRPVAGYKAALTAPAAQQAFGIDQPVWGVLLGEPLGSGATIAAGDFVQLMLETEVAWRVAQRVAAPIAEADVVHCFDRVAPAIELADPGFAGKSNALDLVAGNAAAAAVLVGEARALGEVDPDAADIALSRDGDVLHTGRGSDAPGGQRAAVTWLVNRAVDAGYVLEPGHWLITGALGGMQPGKPGAYTAEFGELGRVEFRIT